MAKWANDSVLDAPLDKIATATQIIVCAGQPTSRADALSKALAATTMSGADFTKGNGDVSGRKTSIAQKDTISITSDGTADHVVLVDSTDLLYVTIANDLSLTTGNTVTIPLWSVTFADPS